MKTDDRILVYESINQNNQGIIKNPGTSRYSIGVAKSTWVFPWKRKVYLNVKNIIEPDNTIMLMIDNNENKKIYVLPKVIAGEKHKLYVYVKSKGILPKRISSTEYIVSLGFLEIHDCYILNQST